MELKELEIYQLSRGISHQAWEIYQRLEWQERKIIGDQWIMAIDSVGANLAEGFGRYHYLDKNRFNYNARGSLLESIHWTELLEERRYIKQNEFNSLTNLLTSLHKKLNNYINVTKEQSRK